MTIKILAPIRETPSDYDEIEARIMVLFRKYIYVPLLAEMKEPKTILQNAKADLAKAIMSGRVRFSRGQFKGRFSASISKELKALGAKWDRTQGSWKIPQAQLPIEITQVISTSYAKFQDTLKKVDKKLASFQPAEIAGQVQLAPLFDSAIYKVEKEIQKTLRGITVQPQLSKEARAKIAEGYSENLQLYIKDFAEKEILELRKQVEKSATSGNRYESLVKTIKDSYGVSQNKAKFLARQETSLLMTSFKQTRYQEAGSKEYIWKTVVGTPAHPVRPFHKKLDGTLQKWEKPPIVDDKGNRNNPGRDYNCRCVALPVIKI